MAEWNKIYKLLSDHKFTTIGVVNDDYKCGICKNILINAHQATCGCNFCFECINQYMSNDVIDCPNNTEECSSESLSNISPNHIFNKRISKLIVRCPNKMCSHETQLIEMENHLNSCSNKKIKCFFNDFGCEHDDTINDNLNDHMLSGIHNHNKILIDLIGNLQNEMQELKVKVKENQIGIKILKEKNNKKDEIIESLTEEIKSIKQEHEDLTQQTEIGYRNLWNKFDKIDIEIKIINNELNLIKQEHEDLTQQTEIGDRNLWYKSDKIDIEIKSINNEINLIKKTKEDLEDQLKIVEDNIDSKCIVEINDLSCEMKELNEKLEYLKDEIKDENENYQLQIYTGLDKIDKFLNMRDDGQLEWQIGRIGQINLMRSAYFYDKQNPCKMFLQLQNINNELNIWLCLYSGVFDDDLNWPCQADMTVIIYNLNDESNRKLLTNTCSFTKPKLISVRSEPIRISYDDLILSNLVNINCKLWCSVKFEVISL